MLASLFLRTLEELFTLHTKTTQNKLKTRTSPNDLNMRSEESTRTISSKRDL